MDDDEKLVQLNIRISNKEKKRLEELAKLYSTSASNFLRHLINQFYMERMIREE